MGGYAFYVWGSFGLTVLIMVVESMLIRRRRVELLAELRNELISERTSS